MCFRSRQIAGAIASAGAAYRPTPLQVCFARLRLRLRLRACETMQSRTNSIRHQTDRKGDCPSAVMRPPGRVSEEE